ncbi:MAG: hypothetical protein M1822_000506 [Bathelium mastoideum]|nr:MAG: hypothetical protein M1822_000506 [Bathelium mastoideum]
MDVENKMLLPHTGSPGRSHVPNFSRPSLAKQPLESMTVEQPNEGKPKQHNSIPITRNPQRTANITRWDGSTRTYSSWDGLRRDEELWFPDGDCLVHFYSRGHSRRGPSLRVPFESLKQAQCTPLFQLCSAQMIPESNTTSPTTSENSSTSGSDFSLAGSAGAKFELYIPCPEETPKDERLAYHVTTRNFFAWMCGKPLVGNHLGKSIANLLDRMVLYRDEQVDNVQHLTYYLEQSGYLDFGNCPDYALAMLSFAEHFELRDLWIDAFVHCVGMNESISLSPEFGETSRVTKALITRAYLEMDLHLGRVSRALSNFLDDDLSSSYLGLSEGARAHLDRFRSFLHSYYVHKFGYWPPPQGSAYPKSLYRSMYDEFSKLYSYLADTENTDIIQKAASGGICVLQNVDAFDGRHKYDPLPYQLPLLPELDLSEKRTSPHKGKRTLRLGSWDAKKDRKINVRSALATATNSHDAALTSCPLIKEYAQFERDLSSTQEEKVSVSDARKVRWLLIYGVVQMLISITRAPPEVRDTEGSPYPLCCLTAGTPPWAFGSKSSATSSTVSPVTPTTPSSFSVNLATKVEEETPRRESTISIHPDCETDNYFTHIPFSRRAEADPSFVPQPLRPSHSRTVTNSTSPVLRASSIRKNLHLRKRFSHRRRGSIKAPRPIRPSQFTEILVHGYGNGLNKASIESTNRTDSGTDASALSLASTPDASPSSSTRPSEETSPTEPTTEATLTFSEQAREARTPILNAIQLDSIHDPPPSLSSASSGALSWAEEANSFSAVSPASSATELSISIYDIAAATTAVDRFIPSSPMSSASSNYSRDSLHDDSSSNSSGSWSTKSTSDDAGISPASSAPASVGHSRNGSLAKVLRAVESMNGAFPEEKDGPVSMGGGKGGEGDRKVDAFSLKGFAKMLAPEEASECGDSVRNVVVVEEKEVKVVDSMESLRARYMDVDLLDALLPEVEREIAVVAAA